jgi:hypothetical protein
MVKEMLAKHKISKELKKKTEAKGLSRMETDLEKATWFLASRRQIRTRYL